MTNPVDADDEIRSLFLGTMPERAEEIDAISQNVSYRRGGDRPGLHLEAAAFAGQGLVTLTDRTMQQFWLIAFLGWQALREQSGFVIGFMLQGLPYDPGIVNTNSGSDEVMGYVDRLGVALQELRAAEPGIMPWPEGVPRFTPDLSELRDEEDRAAYDLGCFACAFALLHETRHAILCAEGGQGGGISEEAECDRYAIGLLLDRCDEYSDRCGDDRLMVRRKRAMGVFLGLVIILESTEREQRSRPTTHPSLSDRIDQLLVAVERLDLPPNDHFWIYSVSVLLSKLRREDRPPSPIGYRTFRELFLSTFNYMGATDTRFRR
jgi:hypothetical protein